MTSRLYRDEAIILRTYKLGEADRIIVMEQGQIVEDGTHAELMDLGGRYASAYSQWEHGS